MEKTIIEDLKIKENKNNITPKIFDNILTELNNFIVSESNLIVDANKEDIKVNKKQIKIKSLLNIVENYRNKEISLETIKEKIIVYKGDPYLTLHICLQAIIQKTKVLLVHDEFMVGVNEILIRIINKVLEKYDILNFISNINEYSITTIQKLKNEYNQVIVIGDTTMYQMLEDDIEIKYFPYNNIVLYNDNKEFEKLKEAIYIYANENQYEIEILYEENIDKVIELINLNEFVDAAILLTQNNDNKLKFKSLVKAKEIFINENCFKNEVGKIYSYLV